MIREIAVTIYLLLFRILFSFFKLFPLKQKTAFVASFGDNILYTLNELEKKTDESLVVIVKPPQCVFDFTKDSPRTVLNLTSPLQWVLSVYHLATSNKIFMDDYFAFLAAAKFKPAVSCVQLWHAAGAVKRFGLAEPSMKNRSVRAKQRIRTVYSRFTHVVAGSDKMANIFQMGFQNTAMTILKTGIPRTDFFYNDTKKADVKQELTDLFPVIRHKKVILYAPTFRDDELGSAKIQLDIQKMYEELHPDYVLFMRLHPSIRNYSPSACTDEFVYDVSGKCVPEIHHLMVAADILITDYSSIPFEFSLFNRPMIFFSYDLERYEKTRGFWEDYHQQMPGPVVRNTAGIIQAIQDNDFDLQHVQAFALEWNQYSNGHASEQLIQGLYNKETKQPPG